MKRIYLILLLVLTTAPVWAQKRSIVPEDLLAFKRVSDPQLSPDGKSIAYVVVTTDRAKNVRTSDLWIVPAEGGTARKVTEWEKSDDTPRWSPDGTKLVFVSNREGGSQLWVMNPASGEVQRLTDISTEASAPVWSPDGKRLAFVSDVYPDCGDDACNKKRDDEAAASKVRAKVLTRLLFRHWNSWKDGKRSHLFVVSSAGGTARDVTPGDYDAPPFSLGGPTDYAFSPDGQEFCFVRNTDPMEAASTNTDLWLVPAAGGEAQRLTTNPAADAAPLYSPDGRYIAYRAQTRPGFESDRWRLMLYDRQSKKHTSITESLDRSIDSFIWAPDSRSLYATAEDQAYEPVFRIPVDGGAPVKFLDKSTQGELQISSDGRWLVFTRQSLMQPAEIYRAGADGSNVRQLTWTNKTLSESLEMNPPEELWWTGAAGARVHGWLIKPPRFEASKKYPLVVLIHGGPQGVWGDAFSYRWNPEVIAGHGFVVFAPNPRGSTGFGQKFTDEISNDWGGKVYTDIMNGVDHVSTLGFVDAGRVGAAGGSYGGYMINWILGHTDRFKALISHDGVYNLTSMYGATEELWFPEWELGGTPWKDPKLYEQWSPHLSAAKFKTPTLVIHGEMDYRVAVGEGLQLFTALQRNNVPSKLLYFPDEGHWVLKPQNSMLWYKTFLEWFDTYLK